MEMANTQVRLGHGRVPRDHPILGHWLAFTHDQLDLIEQLAAYGDWVLLRFPPLDGVFINHPDLIADVLIEHNRDFVKPLTIQRFKTLLGNGLFTSEGDFWRRQRRLIQPAFHHDRIGAYASTMIDHGRRAIATWFDGQQRDVYQDMTQLTFGIVGQTLFGADVSSEASEVGAALTAALTALNDRVSSFSIMVPDAVPIPANVRLRRAVRRLDRIVYRLIEDRRASDRDRGDLLSMLLQVRDEEDGAGMSDRQIRDEVMTMVLAGHETTALALTWAWYLLSQHPDAEARLHSELDQVLAERRPEPTDLPRLTYTSMVINEALRLYPPAWAIERAAIRSTRVGGRPVRRNQTFLMSPWTVQRDPRWFDRPLEFEPGRWADGLIRRLPRFAYFPFGGGPRQCIGNTFALTEATLLLATIGQQFRVRLVSGQDMKPAPNITLRPRSGLQMVVERRTQMNTARLRTASAVTQAGGVVSPNTQS
jgi:cytochrome P450